MSVLPTTTPALIRASNLLLDIRELAEEAEDEERVAIGPDKRSWGNLLQVYEVTEKLLVKIGAEPELGELDVDAYACIMRDLPAMMQAYAAIKQSQAAAGAPATGPTNGEQ